MRYMLSAEDESDTAYSCLLIMNLPITPQTVNRHTNYPWSVFGNSLSYINGGTMVGLKAGMLSPVSIRCGYNKGGLGWVYGMVIENMFGATTLVNSAGRGRILPAWHKGGYSDGPGKAWRTIRWNLEAAPSASDLYDEAMG